MSGAPQTVSAAKLAVAIRKARSEAPTALLASEPIAIIGIGVRFPGGADSPASYWRLLESGTDAITRVPAERWDADRYFDRDPQAPGKTNCRFGGFIAGAEKFDPVLFGIAPREAASMDPQQRLLLEVAWESLWDSGRAPESLAGSNTGVFMAIYGGDHARLAYSDPLSIGPNSCAGVSHSIASGRLSYLLDLHGPSLSIDTACSSSLVASHIACQSLRARECSLALAGGVTLHLEPEHYIALAKLGMLSPDGCCRTFDSRANGFVPGEGCGVVVLKRLAEALADQDRVYAVIRGSAVNQDGRTNVLTAPNGLAQRAVIRAALDHAHVDAASVTYIEAHGTGTPLGDPIEVEALAEVAGPAGQPCALGAVKSNFGHLEAAAGVAGLIKAALALDRGEIPPNLHFEKLNPHISLEGTRFFLPVARTEWRRGEAIRFAGVSSFGFGGTNAHVVLEEAPHVALRAEPASAGPYLLAISARTPEALREFAGAYRDEFGSGRDADSLYAVCRTAALRRAHYEERLAVVAGSREEFRALLDDFLAGRSRAGVARARAEFDPGRIVFLCSGQGSQWPRMGWPLFEMQPVFREAMEECDGLIRKHAGWSAIEAISADAGQSKLQDTEYAQPSLLAIEVALTRLWRSWGIEPAAFIGHSAGEVAAAHLAGVLSLEEAVRLTVHRGRIMQASTGLGKMAVVHSSADRVAKEIETYGGRISIGAINSPRATVISGESELVEAVIAKLAGRGVACRLMPVNYAFHSAQMEPFEHQLVRELGRVDAQPELIPLFSTVLGRRVRGEEMDAAYWGRNIRQPVLFAAALEAAAEMGWHSFLEIGPHPVLLSAAAECPGATGVLVSSLRHNHHDSGAMLSTAGVLYAHGHGINWASIYKSPGRAAVLPVYPYQRETFTLEKRPSPRSHPHGPHPLLGRRIDSPAISGAIFETEIRVPAVSYLRDHRIEDEILLPMTAYLEMVDRAALEAFGFRRALADIAILEPLILNSSAPAVVQIVIERDGFRVFGRRGESWTLHASGLLKDITAAAPFEAKEPAGAKDPAALYATLHGAGIQFGPAFQTMKTLKTDESHAVARIALREAEHRDLNEYGVHPALLDGCLQAAASLVPPGDVFLPFSIARFEIFSAAGGEVDVHAYLRPGLEADLDISTPSGTPVARITGLRLRPRAKRSAGAPVYQVEWVPAPRQSRVGAVLQSFGVISSNAADAARFADALRGNRHQAVAAESVAALDHTTDAIVFLAHGADSAENSIRLAKDVLEEIQECLRKFASRPPQLWLATRGAMHVDPGEQVDGFMDAPLWGLFRTLAMEHRELRAVRVDLDAHSDFNAVIELLSSELRTWDGEEEIAFRKGERFTSRLSRKRNLERGAEKWRLGGNDGSIESLVKQPQSMPEPGPGEIVAAIETSALNFRDTLTVLGMHAATDSLGLEFCGRIAAIGEGVTRFLPGDRVAGLAWGTFQTFAKTRAELIVSVPEKWTAAEAASVPNAFLTAYHSLIHIARLKRGERVLIHAASGGVGLAAVQIAQQAGAEIFATAGSDEKREYLRSLGIRHVSSSRTTRFASEILTATSGAGVDVVLNSLAGEFIDAGFEALAPGGRFLEIGKRGIWTEAQAAAHVKPVSYHVVDLVPLIESEPQLIASHLAHLLSQWRSGALRPLPFTIFEFDQAPDAFRFMAQARHIGKIVLDHPFARSIRSDRTYMITGGAGAIGLQVAEWLAKRGAHFLLLTGRHAPTGDAAGRIEKLRGSGVEIIFREADVSDRDEMRDAMAQIPAPLAGIFHAAGVVDDGVLLQQTSARFGNVLDPKIRGAWNLHELSARVPLDFFVLFSSIAALTGSPGQSAYAAGNAFLDALAHHRRSGGREALSVNWGAWAESGMAARVAQQGRKRALDAIRPMARDGCFAALDLVLRARMAEAAILNADWDTWKPAPRLIASLTRSSTSLTPAAETGMLARLHSEPAAARRAWLLAYLREHARRILGLNASHFIDEQQPLVKVGLDSLMAVEFRNQLASAFERPLNATLLFDYPTLSALTGYLLAACTEGAPEKPEHASDALLEELGMLSDADAEQLLKAELEQG